MKNVTKTVERNFNLLIIVLLGIITVHAYGATLEYGKHFPRGEDAVNYMRGPEGTWEDINGIDYTYNYYSQYSTQNHPWDFDQLLYEAQVLGLKRTCRDANGHLLLDFNHDLEIDRTVGGNSYFEHNGRGMGGSPPFYPFYQYWFDDNWLAREMCRAYGLSEPDGLHDPGSGTFIRWSVVNGTTWRYAPYGSNTYKDQICLDGLYYCGRNQWANAVGRADRVLTVSAPVWNNSMQWYDYDVYENYHLGLMGMLLGQLIENPNVSVQDRDYFRQHYISVRQHILARQVYRDGDYLSWTSHLSAEALMNTETVSCCTLALGADADAGSYEVGLFPMQYEASKNYFYRSHFVLSAALEGGSAAGWMAYGPYHNFEAGNYTAYLYARTPAPAGAVAIFDVLKGGQTIVARKVIWATDMASDNEWTAIPLDFTISSTQNLEFRVWWCGNSNLDLSVIRIKR